jgi:hypothetical protein
MLLTRQARRLLRLDEGFTLMYTDNSWHCPEFCKFKFSFSRGTAPLSPRGKWLRLILIGFLIDNYNFK